MMQRDERAKTKSMREAFRLRDIAMGKTPAPAPAKKKNLTDRAKRYRAQHNAPPGPRRCNFCTTRKNVDIDHITGDESDGEPENLIYLCRPCNTLKGFTQARNKIGVRTRQYNPEARPTLAKFKHAAAILLGSIEGDVGAATAYIRSIAPEKRAQFAETMSKENPPTFAQYAHGVATHQRKAHDEGGAIIHSTPPELRSKYARKIASIKRQRGTNPLFAPQAQADAKKFRGASYGLEVDVTGRGHWEEQGLFPTRAQAEKEGRAIGRKEGMKYRVKITRDTR